MKSNELTERIEALEAKLAATEEAMQNAWGLAIGGLSDRIEALEEAIGRRTQPIDITDGGVVDYRHPS